MKRVSVYGEKPVPWWGRWYCTNPEDDMGVILPIPIYWIAWVAREVRIWWLLRGLKRRVETGMTGTGSSSADRSGE